MKKPRGKNTKALTWREKQAQSLPPRASSPPGTFRLRALLDSRLPRQLLNSSRPDGEYLIDAIAAEMLSTGLLPEVQAELDRSNDPDYDPWCYSDTSPSRAVRDQVAQAARAALDNAYWELVDRPALNEETREHLQDIFNARRLLSRISNRKLNKIAFHLAQFKGVPEDAPLASAQLRGVQIAAQQFDEWAASLLNDFPFRDTPNTNRNVLSWHFINEMASRYEKLTGMKPPVSRSSLFVRLVAAAWQDVGFPPPIDREEREREDVEGWLGFSIEKHEAVTRKSPRK